MKKEFYDALIQLTEEKNVLTDEPLKNHVTFRVGGAADYFVSPESAEEVQKIILLCKEAGMPYYILGNGSNLLVSDQGYRGVIIQIYKSMSEISVKGEFVTAQAGALLSAIAAKAAGESLAGFEFASGIPGTIGGAAVMNAGAYGGEMKDVLEQVTVLTKEGELLTIPREELDMGYRTSKVAKNQYIVLEAVIHLAHGEQEKIREKMNELKEKRTTKQPLEYPSAGSTFKRPEGYFAGKLIEEAGLRGFQVGGAQVSEKHFGFVIILDNSPAAELRELIRQVSERVKANSGVTLEPEVKMLGEF